MNGARWSPARILMLALPYAWLGLFFLVPFLIVVRLSLSDAILAQPPYEPTFEPGLSFSEIWERIKQFDLENYSFLFSDSQYIDAWLNSLMIAALCTGIVLLIGYPIAFGMARAPERWRLTLVMLVILPFWTSFLIRVYAWIGILRQEGFLNEFLRFLGLIDEPLVILNTNVAVVLGIVYSYLPFMILPLYAALERQDETLLEAAADLGAKPVEAFWRITFPLSLPGVIAGSFLVFIPAVGEFVIPDLLGGSGTLMIGRTLWVEFFNNRDWTLASAVAVLLLAVLIIPIGIYQRQQQKALERG